MSAVTRGAIHPNDVVVIRYEGPRGGPGMREMLGVTRPGGIVRIVTHENEGERQGYEGLHQWNICSDRIWNSEGVSVPWSEFPAQVSWRLNSYDPPMLEVILQRDLMPSS